MFEPMLGVTFTPTRIKASEKINVIPSRAELKVDCRVPPGLGEQEVRRGIAEVLGEDGFRIDFTERVVGNRSPVQTPLMDTISAWISEQDPGAETVPLILPGFTDSRHFREAFPECVAYGFFPQRHQSLLQTAPMIHAADERIDVRDLAFATEFFKDLAVRVLA
jgi:acetylornithine deacetylase/succinyl-diaminopimelate desuccinylase-like protein